MELNNKDMEGINKLRAMTMWYNDQSEYLTEGLSLKSLVKLFDFSVKHQLPYMDDDYLYRGNVDEKTRIKAVRFLCLLRKQENNVLTFKK